MKRTLLLVAAALVGATPSLAEGSVNWSDVEPLFGDQPAIRALLVSTLEISPTGMATRFGHHQPHLGGARVGPYRFQVHRKSAAREPLLLTICTKPTFFDSGGHPTTWDIASSFQERLAFVAITGSSEPGPACNDWVDSEAPPTEKTGALEKCRLAPRCSGTSPGRSPGFGR